MQGHSFSPVDDFLGPQNTFRSGLLVDLVHVMVTGLAIRLFVCSRLLRWLLGLQIALAS